MEISGVLMEISGVLMDIFGGHGRLRLAVGQTVACVFTGYRAPPMVGRPTARFLIEDILGADFAVDAFSRRQSESESRRRQVRTGRTTIGRSG